MVTNAKLNSKLGTVRTDAGATLHSRDVAWRRKSLWASAVSIRMVRNHFFGIASLKYRLLNLMSGGLVRLKILMLLCLGVLLIFLERKRKRKRNRKRKKGNGNVGRSIFKATGAFLPPPSSYPLPPSPVVFGFIYSAIRSFYVFQREQLLSLRIVNNASFPYFSSYSFTSALLLTEISDLLGLDYDGDTLHISDRTDQPIRRWYWQLASPFPQHLRRNIFDKKGTKIKIKNRVLVINLRVKLQLYRAVFLKR